MESLKYISGFSDFPIVLRFFLQHYHHETKPGQSLWTVHSLNHIFRYHCSVHKQWYENRNRKNKLNYIQ